MNKKIKLAAAFLSITLLASCAGADKNAAGETVTQFIGFIKSGDTDSAINLCTDDYKEDAASYFESLIQEAALNFPIFLRDDVLEQFSESRLQPLCESLTAKITEIKKDKSDIIVSVDISHDEDYSPDVSFSEEELRSMVEASFENDPIEEIISDYALLKQMSFVDLLTKYSTTTQEELIEDITNELIVKESIFEKNILDPLYRSRDFYLNNDSGTWQIYSID